ncbi:VPS10 domain-containing protein [Fodinibius sp. AD559]|uniref:VPS10 domain-containing protein n=1 Tax=Fodinibius sp. AD559 TaxID=3424179 RepID=UPI004046CED4
MKVKLSSLLLLIFFVLGGTPLAAQDNAKSVSEANYSGLEFRNIGPALFSGRIADIAIHPNDSNTWYVAVGSGGVWKTTNDGVTWDPIFDNQSSYSIGSVTIDPNNPNTVWVGTGENVGGRHVGYGDGVYKSTDGGQSWENMGLKDSEHISKIIVHPKNSDIIWVAAQGPLWDKGGQRGLYKSTDGGQNWEKKLGGNEWTGVTDIELDPRNPDRLYAATWQRQRIVPIYVGGGPGSGIHKSTDGGETWKELQNGIPDNVGKIGMDISPQKPDIVYAAVELNRTKGGVYKSEDRGESWKKMSDAVGGGTGPHYYQELYASPHQFGTLYLMDVETEISTDHGDNFREMDNDKHVDNHALAFKKDEPEYLLMGSDGGLYESNDLGENWNMVRNLPITQFHKIYVDNAKPFYNVYGGTQDNGSQMGPSRTDNESGIANRDWKKTLGADGHDGATEPGNPNIFYGEYQQGVLHRVDKRTGDAVLIQPQSDEEENYQRFNWDSPVEISPHNPTKILFASHKVWVSKNRGNSWTAISGDLTKGDQERITFPIMGKQRSWDNAWDVNAMSDYNTITSLAESPQQEGLIYAGTDDGLLQVTENGGESWREIELGNIDGIPNTAFVNDIKADLFDANTVYVAIDNHKYGDMSPYIIKSTDRGQSWELISGDLPDDHVVWRLVQDDVNKNLMFTATEFGVFFTVDGGEEWVKLESGMPTIAIRDMVIQRQKDDLVAGSFGRGIFILDDYTPLRHVSPQMLNQEAKLFDAQDAYWYRPDTEVEDLGSNFYTAENPPFGANFTYYLKDGLKSLEQQRQEQEEALDEGEDVPFPGWDSIEAQKREEGPSIILTIRDNNGNVVRKIDSAPTTAGFHRVNWDLRYPSKDVVELEAEEGGYYGGGFMATPGTYTATLSKKVRGEVTQLSKPVSFEVKPLRKGTLERASNKTINEFRKDLETFQQDLTKTSNKLDKQISRVNAMQKALSRASEEDTALVKRLHEARIQLLNLKEQMEGSEAKQEIGERIKKPTPSSRLYVGYNALSSTYGPTPMHVKTVEAGKSELDKIQNNLNQFVKNVMPELEKAVQNAGAPPIEDS